MSRRGMLAGVVAAAPAAARAQDTAFPTHAVTINVPFPPGGLGDLAARPLAEGLARGLGAAVPVVNRAGGGGAVGTGYVARAPADGHTLLLTVSSLPVLPEAERLNGRRPSYELADFAPVARVLADPTVLAVPAAAPWRTLEELVAAARRAPNSISYGSSGNYGTVHVAMEMFAAAAGIALLHVPFQGAGPAVTALLTGTVGASAIAPGIARAQVSEGRLRVLASWGAARATAFPEVPTLREAGFPTVEFYIWAGLFAPVGTPPPILERLRGAVRDALGDPRTAAIFAAAGSPLAYQDAPGFGRFLAVDAARMVAVVRRIGRVE